jgi:hypothetical protein
MTASEVLAIAQAAGVRLEARGPKLHVQAPAGTITPEFRETLARYKSVLLVALTPPTPQFVTFNGGLTVPVAALSLALDLEARGISLSTDADHRLIVPPDSRLTIDDLAAIQRWQLHLGAIVEYRAPEV